MKSLILFDIDDTLSVTQPLWHQMTSLYMAMHGYQQIRAGQYRLERSYNIPEEEVQDYREVMDRVFPYQRLEPVAGAVAVVTHLLRQGYDVHFITRRPEARHADTVAWLRNTFGITKPVGYYDEVDTIEEILRRASDQYEAAVLVDNNVDRCAAAASIGLPCILFTGVGIEGDADPNSLSIAKAADYHTVQILLNYYNKYSKK